MFWLWKTVYAEYHVLAVEDSLRVTDGISNPPKSRTLVAVRSTSHEYLGLDLVYR